MSGNSRLPEVPAFYEISVPVIIVAIVPANFISYIADAIVGDLMAKLVIIPAQIRAGRAMLEWSQEQLAAAAGVSLSSVRDAESQRRPLDTSVANEMRRAMENENIMFVGGDPAGGPGVRLGAGRPNIIKLPTVMTMWDGLPFMVEWQGHAVTVYVSREAMDDLGRFRGAVENAEYLKVFEKYRGSILDGVANALAAGRLTEKGQLRLVGEDISALK
jgi:transcriptional regulator with XRE-family HTH domain